MEIRGTLRDATIAGQIPGLIAYLEPVNHVEEFVEGDVGYWVLEGPFDPQ